MVKPKDTVKIVGLIGYPLGHSLSPAMHNAAFKHLGLNFVYLAMPVKPGDVERAVKSLIPLKITGVNVTVPYKEEVIKYLDKITGDAGLIKAVNTIHNTKGRLVGYNTDADGFITSLYREARVKPRGRDVLLIGAGGAGRAIGVKLAGEGVSSVLISDIDLKKAKALRRHIKKCFPGTEVHSIGAGEIRKVIKDVDMLVNATTVGMRRGDTPVVDPGWLHKGMFVYDVVYNIETRLLKEARKKGLKTLGGLGMLVNQGALAFKIWTGRKAPVDVMRKAIEKKVKK